MHLDPTQRSGKQQVAASERVITCNFEVTSQIQGIAENLRNVHDCKQFRRIPRSRASQLIKLRLPDLKQISLSPLSPCLCGGHVSQCMVIMGDTKAWLNVPKKPNARFYACSRLTTSTSRPLSKLLRDCFDGLAGQVLSNSKYERTSFRIPKSISYPNRKAQRLIP